MTLVPKRFATRRLLAAAAATAFALYQPHHAAAEDVSAPVILQWFESTYATQEDRAADAFLRGYGRVYIPPTSKGDSGGFSVGYDVLDRFDLGSPGNTTLYGTEAGIKAMAHELHRAGLYLDADLVWNHNGFRDKSTANDTTTFEEAGDYPGFILSNPGDIGGSSDGDFHSPYASGEWDGRISGLIDIDHSTNHQLVRNPVPGFNNLPAATEDYFGYTADIPTEANRRFYPDRDAAPAMVLNDPVTGSSNIAVYRWNTDSPATGDPIEENATGYLMRNARWLVEEIGVDGFRLDAVKHMPQWVLNYYDQAVYRANPRLNLDGSVNHVFSYGEALDSNLGLVNSYIRKDINPNTPDTVGGNRDALDYPLYFALVDNLSGNGLQNDWADVMSAGLDVSDDGFRNGSRGVMFTQNHDVFAPALNNVAHALILTLPGNASVYLNGKEHGDQRDFPKDGRGDALGGTYGNTITTLVDIRNTHGRGNFLPRYQTKENLAYERDRAMLVMLSNRTDSGSDATTINVGFTPGTHLVELTGNAAANGLPEVVTVFDDAGQPKVNAQFLRNGNDDKGYLVYGLATPQSAQGVQFSNVDAVLAGDTTATNNYENGTNRQADLFVISADTFTLSLNTNKVELLGNPALRDRDADGDNALFRINGGVDMNNLAGVDFTDPNSLVTYGFEQFTDVHSPGYDNITGPTAGNGAYAQTIDATQLPEGRNYFTVRAFRHRDDGGPAVYSDFRAVALIDRLPADAQVQSFTQLGADTSARRATITNPDGTANNVHVLIDLPAALTDSEIIAMLGVGSQANKVDRDLWQRDFTNLITGNHALTVVSFEETGRAGIERIPGYFTQTSMGKGLGDLDVSGNWTPGDMDLMLQAVLSNNTIFNAAADIDANGWINANDYFLLEAILVDGGASQAVLDRYTTNLQAIPEPGAMLTMLTAALGLATRRRR